MRFLPVLALLAISAVAPSQQVLPQKWRLESWGEFDPHRLSPDGRWYVEGGYGKIRIWSTDTWTIQREKATGLWPHAVSPDGTRIACTYRNKLYVIRASDLETELTVGESSTVGGAIYLDANTLLSRTSLWNANTGEYIKKVSSLNLMKELSRNGRWYTAHGHSGDPNITRIGEVGTWKTHYIPNADGVFVGSGDALAQAINPSAATPRVELRRTSDGALIWSVPFADSGNAVVQALGEDRIVVSHATGSYPNVGYRKTILDAVDGRVINVLPDNGDEWSTTTTSDRFVVVTSMFEGPPRRYYATLTRNGEFVPLREVTPKTGAFNTSRPGPGGIRSTSQGPILFRQYNAYFHNKADGAYRGVQPLYPYIISGSTFSVSSDGRKMVRKEGGIVDPMTGRLYSAAPVDPRNWALIGNDWIVYQDRDVYRLTPSGPQFAFTNGFGPLSADASTGNLLALDFEGLFSVYRPDGTRMVQGQSSSHAVYRAYPARVGGDRLLFSRRDGTETVFEEGLIENGTFQITSTFRQPSYNNDQFSLDSTGRVWFVQRSTDGQNPNGTEIRRTSDRKLLARVDVSDVGDLASSQTSWTPENDRLYLSRQDDTVVAFDVPVFLDEIRAVAKGRKSTTVKTFILRNAPSGGTEIPFVTSDPAVEPRPVVVAGSRRSATADFKTWPVSAPKTVTLTARKGAIDEFKTTVQLAPPVVTTFDGVPSEIEFGDTFNLRVKLDGPAPDPSTGWTVPISTGSPYLAAPAKLNLPFLAESAEATVGIKEPGASVTANLTIGGITRSLTVHPRPKASFLPSPRRVKGGETITLWVKTDRPAPAGGFTYSLVSRDPDVRIPASVTIPAGKDKVSFTCQTSGVTAEKTVSTRMERKGKVSYGRVVLLP